MQVERIIRNRSATLYKTFYSNGVPADPTGSPTVTVTRMSDGTAVTTGGVTDEAAAGTWSVTIPATSNTVLDTYTVDWAATVNGVAQEHLDAVEVAGDTLFTLAEARAVPPLQDATKYPDAAIIEMRTVVEDELEESLAFALTPRYRRETLSGDGTNTLLLSRPHIHQIRSVTVGGLAYTSPEVALLSMGITGTVYSTGRAWPTGTNNITVGYDYGLSVAPAGAKRIGLMLAKMWLVGQRSPIDDRGVTFSSTEGGTYSLVVPGRNGSHFGHPDVDAWIDRRTLKVGLA